MTNFVKRNWTVIVAGIASLWGAWGPSINQWVGTHPKWTVTIGVVSAILAHVSPSPISPNTK